MGRPRVEITMTALRRLLGFILLGLIYWFIATSPFVGEVILKLTIERV